MYSSRQQKYWQHIKNRLFTPASIEGYFFQGVVLMAVIIEQYSHFIVIRQPPHWLAECLEGFLSLYTLKTFVKIPGQGQVLQPGKVFATQLKHEYRFHINQLPHLLWYLNKKQIDRSQITIHKHEMPITADISVPVRKGWELRNQQIPAVDFTTAKDGQRSKLIAIRTGGGKTVVGLTSVSRLGKRTAIVILPTYIEKWCGDIVNILNIKPTDIMVVQGSAQLKGLISLAQDGTLASPFIIISSRTLQNFITAYETSDSDVITDEYGILPDYLWPLLGVGTVLIDETHQHIHAMFKMLLYSHVERLIGLTATLITDNYTVERIHKIMYPHEVRFENQDMEKYIHVYAIGYPTMDAMSAKLRTTEWGSNVYSHNAYEKSILSKPHLTSQYMKIIDHLVQMSYMEEFQSGDKLAIYASSVAMCDKITNYLKHKYPDFDVRRYCEQDPYENVIDAQIRVTTIISSGTAIDIPGLRAVILTNSIASSPSNLQVMGRLRKLPDRDVKFYYMYNEAIPKQVDYHKRKVELLTGRAASIKELRSPIGL